MNSTFPDSNELTEFIGDNVGLISAMITERHTRASDLVEEEDTDVITKVAPSAEKDFSRFMPTQTPRLDFD